MIEYYCAVVPTSLACVPATAVPTSLACASRLQWGPARVARRDQQAARRGGLWLAPTRFTRYGYSRLACEPRLLGPSALRSVAGARPWAAYFGGTGRPSCRDIMAEDPPMVLRLRLLSDQPVEGCEIMPECSCPMGRARRSPISTRWYRCLTRWRARGVGRRRCTQRLTGGVLLQHGVLCRCVQAILPSTARDSHSVGRGTRAQRIELLSRAANTLPSRSGSKSQIRCVHAGSRGHRPYLAGACQVREGEGEERVVGVWADRRGFGGGEQGQWMKRRRRRRAGAGGRGRQGERGRQGLGSSCCCSSRARDPCLPPAGVHTIQLRRRRALQRR